MSQTELIERRRAEADPRSGERYLDLAIACYAEDDTGARTSELLCRVGGRWDRRRKRYAGAAERGRVLGVHPGQVEPLRFFDEWLRGHIAGDVPPEEQIYSMLLAGGVRSGKTWLACLIAVCYAVAIPGSIVWIVDPSNVRAEEVEDALESILPRHWYTKLGAPWFRYRLANRSKIVIRSGYDADGLKIGDADLVVVNEAQQMAERVFAIARGRIAAAAGLVVGAANPPTKAIGQWVGDWATEAQAGLRQSAFFHIDPLDNPHIDQGPLLSLAAELDPRTFDIEVRGLFLSSSDTVLHNWDRRINERPPGRPLIVGDDGKLREPARTEREITREFLRAMEGREFDRAVGVDMQRLPHMASGEMRFYENPRAPWSRDNRKWIEWAHAWFTADITLAAADEFDLARAWLDAGWDPDRTLIVADASGKWQFTERDPMKVLKLREETKGRGSWDAFAKMGFVHIVNPDRDLEKNPDVIERCRAATSRIATKAAGPYGQHFLFSDPKLKGLNKAIRMWPTKGGQPMRTSQYAHRGDYVTYLVQRFFPRRIEPEAPRIKVVQKFGRRDQLRDAY